MSDDNKEGAGVPMAWQWVPKKATPEMVFAMAKAWQEAVSRDDPNECVAEWNAALLAAPTPPAVMPAAPSAAVREYPPMPGKEFLGDDVCWGYDEQSLRDYVDADRAAIYQTMQPQAEPAAGEQAGAVAWEALPYASASELLAAFKAGTAFDLHYHGDVRRVTAMGRHVSGTVAVCAGKMLPVIVRFDGFYNGNAPIWLALAATPAPEPYQKALDIRIQQGWQLGGNACPVLYTDTINGEQVRRDDLWLATTAGLKGATETASGHERDATPQMVLAGLAAAEQCDGVLGSIYPSELKTIYAAMVAARENALKAAQPIEREDGNHSARAAGDGEGKR